MASTTVSALTFIVLSLQVKERAAAQGASPDDARAWLLLQERAHSHIRELPSGVSRLTSPRVGATVVEMVSL